MQMIWWQVPESSSALLTAVVLLSNLSMLGCLNRSAENDSSEQTLLQINVHLRPQLLTCHTSPWVAGLIFVVWMF
jgi:hypothetical protein